jgi:hypothetical protein
VRIFVSGLRDGLRLRPLIPSELPEKTGAITEGMIQAHEELLAFIDTAARS